ncbi:hypothetical protein QLX08_006890 [Tetragonisca angustula]|uniref:Uncharacterized protein n=1 Tax=Tetragonisca angustula TaxID=166442 RepID=A0AAW0ZTS0_9HYME
MKVIKLDFGEVEIGKTAVKTIDIWNESYREQIYQVQRDPITNPLDHVFHLRSYTWTLTPDENYSCEICYRPHVAFSKNIDYFIIIDSSAECTKIITYGSSIGPQVTCSVRKIFMCCTMENPEIKRRIKLMNNSDVAATFMFNIDERHKSFQLDTRYGIINPWSYKYITITFTSSKEGRYTYYLVVLILYQEPIIIELYGCCSSLTLKKGTVDAVTYLLKEKDGFKGYMKDVIGRLGDIPPISLSKHYFNFGQADVDIESINPRIPHSICLTNHNYSNLLITWERDADKIFNITPSELLVHAQQSALFELTFNPDIKCNLYGRKMICSVFSENKKLSTFPFVTFATMIGHSFPVTSNGWIPQYEIPQTVIMPPCVPPYPVYTTFLIKKFGHLPLMFQFVSPSTSYFLVKPMIGVIYQDYQIIVVEMTPKSQNEQIYIERWTVYFNGNMKDEHYIDFKGYAEYANIVFSNNNTLNFPSVMSGCQQFLEFAMRNVTRHKIKYQFYQLPPEFNMQCVNGEIDANETLNQECTFFPTVPNIDYDFEAQCIIIVVKSGITVGSKCCAILRVRGSSKIGLLKAIPNNLHFGELEYNDTKTLHFDLINSSSVNIYYKLICVHRNWPFENIEEDVKLHPVSETIFAGSQQRIMVSISPRTAVYYEFVIQYLIRINFRSDILIDKQDPVQICNVHCMCILPTMKVQNICAFAYNQHCSIHISKHFLWERLQVNRLNEVLQNILPGETRTININLFPMLINKGTMLIEWIMTNLSSFPIKLASKRIKTCSCKPMVKTVRYLPQHAETNCVHTDLCVMYIKSEILKSKKETVIGMKIHYSLVGKTTICWELNIGHDRRIMLNVIIDCLTESESQNNFLSSTLVNFGKTYFGNKGAMYRVNWIFNITNNDLPYSVDISNICKMNKSYRCQIFSCLTQYDTIKSGTAVPLLLKFEPRMFGVYKITVPITMGDKTEELILEGESTSDVRLISISKTIPSHCACKTPLFPVYFSIDCINVWFLSTHNSIVKILLVYNSSNFDALAYEWKCQDISEILYVDVFPRKGILYPKAVQSFRIKISTKKYPCQIDIYVPCVFFNASKRREYQRSIIKHTILNQELENQFTITEKGTYTTKSWIEILDPPDQYYKTLSLRCSVYPVEDECINIDLLKELKASPSNIIYFDDSKNHIVLSEKELCIIKFILEGLLWDIVNSKRFKQLIENVLFPERNLYYTQFMMNIWERKRLIRRSYISPPLSLIDSILEQMLFMVIHDEFSLKTTHLIPNEDIRHYNYLKMLPKQKRTDLEKDLDEDYNKSKFDNNNDNDDDDNGSDVAVAADNDDSDNDDIYLRTGFRVSFAE